MKLKRLWAGSLGFCYVAVIALLFAARINAAETAGGAKQVEVTAPKVTAQAMPAVKKEVKSAEKATEKAPKYVASSESKTYHLASCMWAKKIKPENLVGFSSEKKAETAGYQPCKICLKKD